MAFVNAKSGAAIAGDAAVELALDAYDAAVLLVARAQDALSNLGASLSLSAAGGATGVKAAGSVNPLLDPSTPLGSFLTSVVGGAAYFADAAANGQWAKILCYKPFKTVAAVTLTVLRIVVSWFLSGAEFACSMLYATPAYAAAIAIVAIVAIIVIIVTHSSIQVAELVLLVTSLRYLLPLRLCGVTQLVVNRLRILLELLAAEQGCETLIHHCIALVLLLLLLVAVLVALALVF